MFGDGYMHDEIKKDVRDEAMKRLIHLRTDPVSPIPWRFVAEIAYGDGVRSIDFEKRLKKNLFCRLSSSAYL